MRIDQLLYLLEIANAGSFSKAAERLHISQPSLSQSIASLEEELGIQLFKRSRHGAQLTETGTRIFDKAYAIHKLMDDIKGVAEKQQSLLSGKLRIASIPSFCMTILPRTALNFKYKFPNIQIEIVEEGSLEIVNYLTNGSIDLGLVSRRSAANFDDSLSFTPLFEGRVMACVNSRSPYANKKSISLKEIIQWPLVLFNQNYRMHSHLLTLLKQFGEPNILLTAKNSLSIKKVVIEGLAIGFDASIALKSDPFVESGAIIPLDIIEETSTVFGILHKKKYLTTASEEFIAELSDQAANFRRIYNLKSH
ncbi:MAG: transcriptional regulator [Sporomusa sp.]|nr:transcriptional regulator [Sporomusa sp.]